MDRAFEECVERCLHAADEKDADSSRAACETSCGEGVPLVTDGRTLMLSSGKRVRVAGVVIRAAYPTTQAEGTAIALGGADGVPVWVDAEGLPEGWSKLLGMPVEVEGDLTQGPTGNGERIRIPFLESLGEPVRKGEPE